MTNELEKKVERSIKLLQSCGRNGDVIEVAYSGGKDSDVILELAKMSGINYRAIYKNTTIDPPGTIKHVRDMGVEIRQPKETFFMLLRKKGLPNRFVRFCCSELKEYKILDRVIMGIRKSESVKRGARYSEPTECRFYGSKKEHVEAIYPILEWTNKDVEEFVTERQITCAPVYYKNGKFDVNVRLGCMCCPLKGRKARLLDFIQHPNMVKAYIRNLIIFRQTHPDAAVCKYYADAYEQLTRDLFYDSQRQFNDNKFGLFPITDYKSILENYFQIKF